jgi:hypothetical protein
MKIEGIIYSVDHPVVMINGKTLNTGASIDGVKVISIGPSQVVLAYAGEQKMFKVK